MTGLKKQIESLEKSLVRAREEAAEKATGFEHSERELSALVEKLQQELSTVKDAREREREESAEELKKVLDVSSAEAQRDLKAKEQVCFIGLNLV